MSGNRIDKVNSLLKHEISKIIQKEINFSNDVLVTLTYVKTTANLIEARVFISVLPEERLNEVLEILKRNVFMIQQKINKKLNMRPIPKIMFMEDKTESEADKIEKIIKELKKDEN